MRNSLFALSIIFVLSLASCDKGKTTYTCHCKTQADNGAGSYTTNDELHYNNITYLEAQAKCIAEVEMRKSTSTNKNVTCNLQ